MYKKLLKILKRKKILILQKRRSNNFKKRINKLQKHKDKMRKKRSLVLSSP